MSENGEIYTAGKNFTLPPAVTALTNSTSANMDTPYFQKGLYYDYNSSFTRKYVLRHNFVRPQQRYVVIE